VTEVQLFDFNSRDVRVVTGPDGEPWFVAADVAGILGYRDAANAIRPLDDDERGYSDLSTPPRSTASDHGK
jgi:anti-repressor protein